MRDFQQLNVWRRAHDLILRPYVESKQLPASETIGLTTHLRRSAVAISRGIAEDRSRDTGVEFAADLSKARAASMELEYILLLCHDLGFFPESLYCELQAELTEVGKMLSGLLKRILMPAPESIA